MAGQKLLVDLLDKNCPYTIPVVLIRNFARDILTLAPINPDIINQPPIGIIAIDDIPNGMFLYQVPIILPLFSDHKVKQGSIEDKDVHNSLCSYYPIRNSR